MNIINQIKKPMKDNKHYLCCETTEDLMELTKKNMFNITKNEKTNKN